MTSHSIPVGRPQPKLSRLLVKESSEEPGPAPEESPPQNAVFWDLQQARVPPELCTAILDVLDSLCRQLGVASITIVTEVPASTLHGAQLLAALSDAKSVQLLSFLRQQGQVGANAAEYELKRVRPLFSFHCTSQGFYCLTMLLASDT